MAQKYGLNLPLLRQYDKIFALLVLVGLLLSLVRLTQSSSERSASKANYVQALDALRPVYPHAKPCDMTVFDLAFVSLRAPRQLPVMSNETAGVFIPERRVWCVECRRPIAYVATQCPFCNAAQPDSIRAIGGDTDKDGIPDAKEIEWNLNPLDPGDAVLDADQDGFSNLQEFNADDNARDPESHPELDVLLRVMSIEAKRFPMVLKGASRMPTGALKIQVNLLAEDGREVQNIWVFEGNLIGTTGLKMGAYVEKKEMLPNPRLNNKMMEVDCSTATVIRQADGRSFSLKVGDKRSSDVEAVLILPLDKTTYAVSTGGSFKLRNQSYNVINIDTEAYTVVIENKSTGKKIFVPR